MDSRFFKSGSQEINNGNLHQINHAISYRFRDRLPNQVTIWATPASFEEEGSNVALYAQDQWTVRRVTLNLGVRYDDYRASSPEQVLEAGFFVPRRVSAAEDELEHWRNLNPRLGVVSRRV
jgi:outer membrane receptor protein involved in Fe transport